ncbi:MAG: long-chain-acyl-CoA synthetase [Actinobacteria bacterium]|nr:long-chain-acyl-CoA synthetase [Actinomycetota bacterium]
MGLLDLVTPAVRTVRFGLPLITLKAGSSRTIPDVMDEVVRSRPDHPAILDGDRSVSYRQLDEGANRVARWAQGIGVGRGDRVGLLMLNRPEYVETWLGLAKVGATTALLNTNLTGVAIEHAVEAASATHLIVGSECLDALATADVGDCTIHVRPDPTGDAAVLPDGAVDLDAELAELSGEPLPLGVRSRSRTGDDLFFIYTSGTTGLPKAARFSHLRFMTTASGPRIAGFDPDDVMYCALPLYHTAGGVMAVGAALLSGGTVALRRKFSASEFWSDVRRYDATVFQYIGEFCRYLLHAPPNPDERRHRIKFCIGNGLRPDIWDEFQERFAIPRIVEFYGATEGNVALLNLTGERGSVGRLPSRLIADARIVRYDVDADELVRNADGRVIECGPDEPGELIAAIPTTSKDMRGRFEGYTSDEATERKILRDAFKEGDAFFRTGDLLSRDRRGFYYFVDRIGDTFRWKGENVSTQEVAEAISGFPGVLFANVYGVEVPHADGRAGMVALQVADPKAFDGAAFGAHVADALPAYAAPVFVRIQPESDVTGTFKLRKVDLQREGFDPTVVADPVFVRDDDGSYVKLTKKRCKAITDGSLR